DERRTRMAKKQKRSRTADNGGSHARVSSTPEELMLAALERGDDTLETGRLLVTFKEGAAEEGLQSFGSKSMRVANARDFDDQAAVLEEAGDADAFVFPEIGVALISGGAARGRGMGLDAEIAARNPIGTFQAR